MDNSIVDESATTTVTITASASGYTLGAAQVTVTDDEIGQTLSITVASNVFYETGSDDAFAFPVMRSYADRVARWADRSFLDPGFRPDPAGRTLTLSTCAYHSEDGKLLVHAELID